MVIPDLASQPGLQQLEELRAQTRVLAQVLEVAADRPEEPWAFSCSRSRPRRSVGLIFRSWHAPNRVAGHDRDLVVEVGLQRVTATRTILGVAGVGLTVRGSDRAGVHQIHHTYGDLLGSLKRERDEAMTVTQERSGWCPISSRPRAR